MHGVDNWRDKENEDEELALIRRSAELKLHFENTVEIAKANIISAQEKQVKTQNKQKNTSNDHLSPGTEVYIRSEKIQNKLVPLFSGPYFVKEQTKYGNYILNDNENNTLEDSYPRWR